MVGWGRVETMPPALLFVDFRPRGYRSQVLRSWSSRKQGLSSRKTKLTEGAVGGRKLKIVPYTVRQLFFGDMREDNVAGLYDGPFPWENKFGFHLAGMVGHDFFKPFAVTFDFENMQIFVQ